MVTTRRFLCLLAVLLAPAGAFAQAPARKAVFIIVDGIPADVIESVPTPHLDDIARAGGYTRAYTGGEAGGYSETPTISAVGYNSLLTGTWANKHNVWGNGIKAPNYHYPTVFRLMKDQYPAKRTAIFSTWLDNRTKLVGEGLAATGNIRFDYHYDGFELDTVRFPHDTARKFINDIDELVTNEAARYLAAEGPDLTWVYLEYTDDIGHRHGDGPEMTRAVEIADAQVGRIRQAVQRRARAHNEEWMILITTDHGRDAATGRDHGGQSERERTIWMTTNLPNLNAYFHNQQPAMVDILPTIARFMDFDVPHTELDGVPMVGPVSVIAPEITRRGGEIEVTWTALDPSGSVKVKVSTTNHRQHGRADDYRLVGTVPTGAETFTFDASALPSDFYKVMLEAPHNTVNRWLLAAPDETADY
ncbi:MAG: alkaline phosphatase family protein [Catalinimonas sp.]